MTFDQRADAWFEAARRGVTDFQTLNATVVLRSAAENPAKAHLDIPVCTRLAAKVGPSCRIFGATLLQTGTS